ncbi:hypothetical protein [Roseibium sp.]|uniref:hypothetical protein n=1 Tax=Roseibium sp. TaxID=1936156 RepID=UPI0032676C55
MTGSALILNALQVLSALAFIVQCAIGQAAALVVLLAIQQLASRGEVRPRIGIQSAQGCRLGQGRCLMSGDGDEDNQCGSCSKILQDI